MDSTPPITRSRFKSTQLIEDEGNICFNKKISKNIDIDRLKEIENYQTQLRKELKTESGLVFHLGRIIRKRRKRRAKEKFILNSMRGLSLSVKEKEDWYSYLLEDEIEWFDICRVPNDGCVLHLGRRSAGKSFGLRWLLYTKRKVYPVVYCCTKTKHNGQWIKHINTDMIFKGWSQTMFEGLKQRQEFVIENPQLGIDPRVAIILDDMASDPSLRFNPSFVDVAYTGRHDKALICVTSQWYKQLAPGFRDNSDVLFLYKMDNDNEVNAIWAEHGAGIPKQTFKALVQKYSTDNTALVIVKNGITPLGKFFQYRAIDPGPFRMGTASIWGEDSEEEEED